MRRKTHLLLGTLAFLAYTYPIHLLLQIPPDTILAGFFAACFGSVMPDVLEPARHGNHRGPGHSRRAVKVSALVFAATALAAMSGTFFILPPSLSFIVSAFFLGYAVHLLADAVTPAGLPG